MTAKALLCDSFHCRLCGEENKNGTQLFSEDENTESLSQLVNKYLPIKVEDTRKYPRTICPGCHIQLEATKLFLDLVIEGQAKLRRLYQVQQETLQRLEKQKQKLEATLKSVNPSSTVETYTIETDAFGDKYLIQIFSEGPLFPPEHELSLRAEGLEKPRRKRGRPPKQANVVQEEKVEEVVKSSVQEEENTEGDGRRRRKIRAPARYQGVVQGAEMDKILKEEGVLDQEDIAAEPAVVEEKVDIIGRIETENGDVLGEPVFTYKPRFHSRYSMGSKKKMRKKYACDLCKKEFLHPGRLELHRKSHNIRYKCVNCNFDSDDKDLVQKHLAESNHGEAIAVEHVKEVELNKPFDITESTDLKTGNNISEPPTCALCEKAFDSKQDMDIHIQTIHGIENCDKCEQTFANNKDLKTHQLMHTKNHTNETKQYPCDQCSKILRHPSSLLYHKETVHNNGKRFICNTCNRSFKHRQLLQRHQLVHTTARPYICKHCQECFKTQANLVNHQSVHSGVKKFCCNICGQKFAHRTSLTLHQRWHQGHKPYKCEYCDKTFTQKGNLVEHKRIHTGEKPFCCELCGRSFTTSSQFSLHLKRHTGERPWSCQYCTRRFLHRDTYKAHLRRHLGDRPHKCHSCSRSFAERWALRRHERVHSGEKPYGCPECDRTFSDSSNRQKHLKTHSVTTSEDSVTKKMPVKGVKCSNIKPKIFTDQHENQVDFEEASIELTQLVDESGNPISIKIDGGYNIPVVTSDNKKTVHGLMPDGTLVPIEVGEVGELTEKADIVEEIEIDSNELLNIEDQMTQLNEINMLKPDQSLGTNIQLLADEENPGMCLLTYSVDNQQLGIDTFLIDSMKKSL